MAPILMGQIGFLKKSQNVKKKVDKHNKHVYIKKLSIHYPFPHSTGFFQTKS
jgi:hypothetical protein